MAYFKHWWKQKIKERDRERERGPFESGQGRERTIFERSVWQSDEHVTICSKKIREHFLRDGPSTKIM